MTFRSKSRASDIVEEANTSAVTNRRRKRSIIDNSQASTSNEVEKNKKTKGKSQIPCFVTAYAFRYFSCSH